MALLCVNDLDVLTAVAFAQFSSEGLRTYLLQEGSNQNFLLLMRKNVFTVKVETLKQLSREALSPPVFKRLLNGVLNNFSF